MMKKFLSVGISVIVLFSICVAAYADDTKYSEGKLYYTIQGDSVTIVGAFGSDEVITVPSAIAGYPVNTIAAGAFTSRTHLKTLNLPDTITTVEEGALPTGVTVVYDSPASRDANSGTEATPVPSAEPMEVPTDTPAKSPSPKESSQPAEQTANPEEKADVDPVTTPDVTDDSKSGFVVDGKTETVSEEDDITDTVEVFEDELDSDDVGEGEADLETESNAVSSEKSGTGATQRHEDAVESETTSDAETGKAASDTEPDAVKAVSPVPFIVGGIVLLVAAAAVFAVLRKKKQNRDSKA